MFEKRNRLLTRGRHDSGQTIVEFALSLSVLLLLIFGVIEGGRLLHGWITLQNAAREGGRYAITGQYEEDCLSAEPACPDARVWSIEQRVLESTTGLSIDPRAGYDDPRYLRVEVSGVDKDNVWRSEYPGLPGKPVMIRAIYHMPVVTPLIRPIAKSIRLTGQVVVNNENYAQVSQSKNDIDIGDLPPPPPPTIPVADLEVRASASPLVTLVNEPINFVVQVTNHGPDEARGVEVVDTLPAGVTLLSITPDGICNQAGQVVTCTLPDLPRGVVYNIQLTVRAPADPPPAPGVVVNRVSVSGSEQDDDLSNNEDAAESLVVLSEEVSDLAIISIDDTPDPVVINQEVTYRVLVRNNGISDATGVEVSGILPDDFAFISGATSSGGGCDGSGTSALCQVGDIASGETGWADITASAPSSPGTAIFATSVTGDQVDPDDRNNAGTEVTTISPEWSDLYVSMTDWPDPALVGEEVTYTIIAGNNGPSNAQDVIVVDTLPEGVEFVSATGPGGGCSEADGEVTCDVGVVLRHQEVTIEVAVTASDTGTIFNQAAISGQQTDPNPVNDQVTTVTTLAPSADLAITMSADPATPPGVRAGELLTYLLVVTNNGPSPATNVEVVDELPADASYLRASPSQGICSHIGDTVDCYLGNMANGDTAEIVIDVIPEQEGVLVNRARVSSRQADIDQSNNSVTDSTTVLAPYNQFITLDPSCGDPGTPVRINGFNWPSEGNKDIQIYWGAIDNGNLIHTVPDNGSSWSVSIGVPMSAVPGEHTIIADRRGDTAEAQYKVPCPAPNLITTEPVVVSAQPVTVDEPVTFQVEVTNNGDLDAVNQFFVGLYFDPPSIADPNLTHISQQYRAEHVVISWLGTGQSRLVTITEEDGFSVAGTHEVYVVVDSDPGPTGLIKELSELDNISTRLVIEVEANPSPTPTPGPTPTPTPVVNEPGSLIGQAFLSPFGGQPLPQVGVEVAVYDIDAGILETVGFTDIEGSYFLPNLTPGMKTVSACIIIDDVQYTYTATGVEIISGEIAFKDLFLEEGLCH